MNFVNMIFLLNLSGYIIRSKMFDFRWDCQDSSYKVCLSNEFLSYYFLISSNNQQTLNKVLCHQIFSNHSCPFAISSLSKTIQQVFTGQSGCVSLANNIILEWLKTMFNLQFEQVPYEESPSPDYKQSNLTAFTSTYRTPTPTGQTGFEHFPQPVNCSMDRDLYLSNANMVRKGIIDYLKACLLDSSSVNLLLRTHMVFGLKRQQGQIMEENSGLQTVTTQNELLLPFQRKAFLRNFEEYGELTGELLELNQIFSKEIMSEIVYILHMLMQAKGKAFSVLMGKEKEKEADDFLPKMDRFWDNEGQQDFFKDSWQTFESLDYEQIKKFGAEGVEEIALKIYFSNKLKFLTLNEAKLDLKDTVDVGDKFATLAVHLSRNLFLNLAGMAQREQQENEMVNQLSFYYVEQTLTETLTKKRKLLQD